MKTQLAILVLCGGTISAHATVIVNVISSTPVMQVVSVPQQSCHADQVVVEQPKTGVGATLGAVAGGVIGSTMGHGSGKVAATTAGVVTGAVVGNSLEKTKDATQQTVQTCSTVMVTQQQIIGYDVVYEYAGQRVSTRMTKDPGATMSIEVVVPPPVAVVPAAVDVPARRVVIATPPAVVVTPAPAVIVRRPPLVVAPLRPARLPPPVPHGAAPHGGNPGHAPSGEPGGGQGQPAPESGAQPQH